MLLRKKRSIINYSVNQYLKQNLNKLNLNAKVTFLMILGIRGTFEFADYEFGEGGVQKQIHILVELLTYY